MRNNSLLMIAVVVFGLLVFGGYLVANGSGFGGAEQVSSPEASTLDYTDNQLAQLAVLVFLMIGGLVSIGVGLALTFWFLNREVKKATETSNRPFAFSLKPEGNSIGAIIQENSFMIALTIGILLILVFVGLVLFTGALA